MRSTLLSLKYTVNKSDNRLEMKLVPKEYKEN